MDNDFKRLFEFILWSSKLRSVTRHNNATSDRKESVAEHSWHLALMCWTLSRKFEEEFSVSLNIEKMIKMALIHDLVEIEAGDPSAWSTDHGNRKMEREEAIAQEHFSKLGYELSEELLSLWHEHEKAESIESKIVRGIDRINPAIMRYATQQGWEDVQGTAEKLDELQLPRIKFSKTLTTIYEEIKRLAINEGLLPV